MIGKAIDGEGEALLYVLKLNEEEGKPGVGKPLRVERRANTNWRYLMGSHGHCSPKLQNAAVLRIIKC